MRTLETLQLTRAVASAASLAVPRMLDERELVDRITEGDESAFERVFRTFYAPLCDYVFSYVRSTDIAEDIVQGVFSRIWEQRHRWRPAGGVNAYLFVACRNAAIDSLRHDDLVARKAAKARAAGDRMGAAEPPPRPDDAAAANDLSSLIARAIAELPERRREVVVLRWRYALTSAEIAQVTGTTIKSVEARFTRALGQLRTRLAHLRK